MRNVRAAMQDATVRTVYRHACSDAAAAASAQDWSECARLIEIARSIERAYPETTSRARFAGADIDHASPL